MSIEETGLPDTITFCGLPMTVDPTYFRSKDTASYIRGNLRVRVTHIRVGHVYARAYILDLEVAEGDKENVTQVLKQLEGKVLKYVTNTAAAAGIEAVKIKDEE